MTLVYNADEGDEARKGVGTNTLRSDQLRSFSLSLTEGVFIKGVLIGDDNNSMNSVHSGLCKYLIYSIVYQV